jgi:hypothetical protein
MTIPALPRRRRPILPSRVRLLCALPTLALALVATAPAVTLDLTYPPGTTSAGPTGTTAAGLVAVATLLAWLATRRRHSNLPSWDGNDLTVWHPAHHDPGGDVWAVTPPCGYGTWTLYAPGSPNGGPWPYVDVTPAAEHPTLHDDEAEGADRLVLADDEHWMRPWIEQVSGGRVTEMTEGWGEPYGPDRDLLEYVIYARVAR